MWKSHPKPHAERCTFIVPALNMFFHNLDNLSTKAAELQTIAQYAKRTLLPS